MVEKPAVGGEGIPLRLCLAGYIFCCKIEVKTENQWFPEVPYFITTFFSIFRMSLPATNFVLLVLDRRHKKSKTNWPLESMSHAYSQDHCRP